MADGNDSNPRHKARATAVPDGEPVRKSKDTRNDEFLGADAGIPFDVDSPVIDSRFPDAHTITPESHEYERRIRAQMSPVYAMAPRRRPPLEWLWKRYRRFSMRNRSGIVDDFGRDPVFAARVEPVLDFLSRRYFKVSVRGHDHVPDAGPAILVLNHAGPSPWDAILFSHAMYRMLPATRPVRTLIEDEAFYFPYLGVFLNRIGAVRACHDNARRLLERQSLLAVFPEVGDPKAVDSHDPRSFGRGGFVKLAIRQGAPLVPVGVTYAESGSLGAPRKSGPAVEAFQVLPRPATWKFHIGEPIKLSKDTSDDPSSLRTLAGELRDHVRALVQAKNDDKDFVALD
jgi:1-acyl-sn-glycerol-3-phosphate acyltransferase